MKDILIEEQSDERQEQRANIPAETSTKSQPINNTCLRRFLVLAAVKLLKRIVPSHGAVIFISNKLCIKFGPLRHLLEASAMRFIAQYTSIPVPKVYCAFTRKGWTYIAMEKINGKMLGSEWDKRSDDSKAKILQQLKRMVRCGIYLLLEDKDKASVTSMVDLYGTAGCLGLRYAMGPSRVCTTSIDI